MAGEEDAAARRSGVEAPSRHSFRGPRRGEAGLDHRHHARRHRLQRQRRPRRRHRAHRPRDAEPRRHSRGRALASESGPAGRELADRLETEPGRKEAFFEWPELVERDFRSLTEQRGLDRVVQKMAGMFGEEPARAANERYGTGLRVS